MSTSSELSARLRLPVRAGGDQETTPTIRPRWQHRPKVLSIATLGKDERMSSRVVEEIATHYGDCPSVAYRIAYEGVALVFSGDMDASALLIRFEDEDRPIRASQIVRLFQITWDSRPSTM